MVPTSPLPLLRQNPILGEMIATGHTWSRSGERIPLSSGITPENAQRLYEAVLRARPKIALEIGMAHGVSTLAILTALRELKTGTLVSVDPVEMEHWGGAGLEAVRRSGLDSCHELLTTPDYFALPDLLRRSFSCDLAYIDGVHSFESTFVDFFFVDRLLTVGGWVGFNDCGMPSVRKVIRYIQTHTSYQEQQGYILTWSQRRKLKFWEHPDRFFRKDGDRRVPWNYYKDF